MPSWPQTLPPINLPLEHEHQDATLRTEMDTGPAKVRPRFSASMEYYQFPLRMTGQQYQILFTFYQTTLYRGALAFDFENPVTGNSELFRFRRSPRSRVRRGSNNPDERIWDVEIALEKLP